MPIPGNLLPFIIGGVLLLVIVGAVVMFMQSRGGNVDDRLEQFVGPRNNAQKEPEAKPLEKIDAVVSKGEQGNKIKQALARADIKLTVTEFFGVKLVAAIIGAGVGAYVGRAAPTASVLVAVVGAVFFSFVPNIYIGYAAKARITRFNDQLGDTINMMANSLRSGYSFMQSLALVGREAPNPTAGEFERVVREVGLGLTVDDALKNLLKRVPSDDLDLLITAVNIQMESGGNLAQILETIGHTIRERVRIKGEIQVLTAQGQISAYVITALPIGLAIFISVINPGYMAPMFTFGMPPEAWCCLPVASLTMITIGFFTIMKIVSIEV